MFVNRIFDIYDDDIFESVKESVINKNSSLINKHLNKIMEIKSQNEQIEYFKKHFYPQVEENKNMILKDFLKLKNLKPTAEPFQLSRTGEYNNYMRGKNDFTEKIIFILNCDNFVKKVFLCETDNNEIIRKINDKLKIITKKDTDDFDDSKFNDSELMDKTIDNFLKSIKSYMTISIDQEEFDINNLIEDVNNFVFGERLKSLESMINHAFTANNKDKDKKYKNIILFHLIVEELNKIKSKIDFHHGSNLKPFQEQCKQLKIKIRELQKNLKEKLENPPPSKKVITDINEITLNTTFVPFKGKVKFYLVLMIIISFYITVKEFLKKDKDGIRSGDKMIIISGVILTFLLLFIYSYISSFKFNLISDKIKLVV